MPRKIFKIETVIVRHICGHPIAFPVIVTREKRRNIAAAIVMTFEDRMQLHRTIEGGIDWCAKTFRVKDKNHDGGIQMIQEKYFSNAETLAVDVESIQMCMPSQVFQGVGGECCPVEGLSWRDANLIEAVQLALAFLPSTITA